jgi:flagellar motor switch protein FliG
MDQFGQELGSKTSLGVGSDDYIRNMLVQALGSEKAGNLIDRILLGRNTTGLDALKWMDPRAVADLVRNEHPQIIAIVMAHLETDQAADALKLLPDRTRVDVLLRIATLDGIPPNALNELNEIMERQFAGNQNLKSSNIGGVQCAANILNFMDSGQDQAILGDIARIDAELSNRIQDLMFVFDDLVDLDDREMQLVLREVSGERLGLALRGADIKVRDKITRNMSQRAADPAGRHGSPRPGAPVRRGRRAAEILAIVKRMADEGTDHRQRDQRGAVRWRAPDPLASRRRWTISRCPNRSRPRHEEPPLQLPTLEEIQAIQDSARRKASSTAMPKATAGPGRGEAPPRRADRRHPRQLQPAAGAAGRTKWSAPWRAGRAHRRRAGRPRLRGRPGLLAQLVGEAIDACAAPREVEVRLHPDDIAALPPAEPARRARLVPDTSSAAATCACTPKPCASTAPWKPPARRAGPCCSPPSRRTGHERATGRLAGCAQPAPGRRLGRIRAWIPHRGLIREGVLRRAVGLTLEAVGCEAPLGASCKVEVVDGGWVDAEVVGFAGDRTT